jgi:hypothetical protein
VSRRLALTTLVGAAALPATAALGVQNATASYPFENKSHSVSLCNRTGDALANCITAQGCSAHTAERPFHYWL